MAASWNPDELATATGETVDHLAALTEAGLLLRRADGWYESDALTRLQLIHFARDRGVSEEHLAAAVGRQGDLLGLFEGLGGAAPTRSTLGHAGTELGLSAGLLTGLMDALGRDPSDIATTEDLDALRLFAQATSAGLEPEPLLQLVRVYAELLNRLADAEVRTFHEYVHGKFRAAGLTGSELLAASGSLGKALLGLVEPAVLYFHRRAWERVSGEDLLRHLMEDSTPVAAAPGESLTTVLFIDLAGFTPLTVAMGDAVAADIVQRFAAMVRATADTHGGRIVKQIGDAFMLTFTEAADALGFGVEVATLAEQESQFPAVHIGAHTGPVLFRDGDYIGAGVNLAARVASVGGPGQFLITVAVHAAARQVAGLEFTELPPRRLKGLPEPVPLIDVRPAGRTGHAYAVDPVCGMRLARADVMAVEDSSRVRYSFCSPECADQFRSAPAHYAAPAVTTDGKSN